MTTSKSVTKTSIKTNKDETQQQNNNKPTGSFYLWISPIFNGFYLTIDAKTELTFTNRLQNAHNSG